jgi:hypothetical protein
MSLQLFPNNIKDFELFLYNLEFNIISNTRTYTKTKIDKDISSKELFNGKEKVLESKLFESIKHLVQIIELAVLRRVKCIEAEYVVANIEEPELWLVGCNSIVFDAPIILFAQTFQCTDFKEYKNVKHRRVSTVRIKPPKKLTSMEELVVVVRCTPYSHANELIKENTHNNKEDSIRNYKNLNMVKDLAIKRRGRTADYTNIAQYSITGVSLRKNNVLKYSSKKVHTNKSNVERHNDTMNSLFNEQKSIECNGKAAKSYHKATSKSASRIVMKQNAGNALGRHNYLSNKPVQLRIKKNIKEEYTRPKFCIFVKRVSNFRCNSHLISKYKKLL